MMASASVTPTNTTRALFTSRPYLVGSTYTTDQSSIYDDSKPDDGHFFEHIAKELGKAAGAPGLCKTSPFPCSALVEAHIKVKSRPFDGPHTMHFLVRPPSVPVTIGGVTDRLAVSFHFTVRPNVAVQVSSSTPDTVDVIFTMDGKTYIPPPLPANPQHRFTEDELATLDPEAGTAFSLANAIPAGLSLVNLEGLATAINSEVALQILNRGIQADQYVSQENAVDMLSQTNAVQNADSANIPANAGITVDQNQPYPVTGWMEVKWARPVLAPNQPVKKPVQPPPKPVQIPRPPVVKQ